MAAIETCRTTSDGEIGGCGSPLTDRSSPPLGGGGCCWRPWADQLVPGPLLWKEVVIMGISHPFPTSERKYSVFPLTCFLGVFRGQRNPRRVLQNPTLIISGI